MAYQLITVMLHKLIKVTATLLRYETIEYSGLVLLLCHYSRVPYLWSCQVSG